jgi:tubby and related proteins
MQGKDLFGKEPRKIKVLTPKVFLNKAAEWKPRRNDESMMYCYSKRNKLEDIATFISIAPKWDAARKGFILNFNGRVTCASVKNFQLSTMNDST